MNRPGSSVGARIASPDQPPGVERSESGSPTVSVNDTQIPQDLVRTRSSPTGEPMADSPTTNDPPPSRPYSAFSKSTKWLIVGLSGMAGLLSPISSNIFVPAIPLLAKEFHRSTQDISLAVTIYLIFQAVTPSFFGSMSDTFGRRPLYIATLLVYLGANIGLAVMPTSAYWLLLLLRALQSTGGSAVVSIGAGSISDIAEPRERGKFYATFQLGALFGPAFGPLIGGVLSDTLGWRSIFWFLTITTGVILVPLIIFLPETLRSLVGDGSIPPPLLSMNPSKLFQHWKAKSNSDGRLTESRLGEFERPPPKKYQPLSAFMILFTPEILLIFWLASLLYMQFYCITTVFSTELQQVYHLSELKIGLSYLPNGFGTMFASQVNGRQLDWYYRREERRVGGDYGKVGEDFRLELTRIRCLAPFAILFISASIAQGWCLEARAPLAATLVVGFFVGLGSGTLNTVTLYGQDLMPGKGGAVSASFNLTRCLMGAVGTAVVQIIYHAIGAGWMMVLFSGITLTGVPPAVLVIKRAKYWRWSRRRQEESKALENCETGAELDNEQRQRMFFTSGRIEKPLARLSK